MVLQKICIMGGTFNPPHIAHVNLANSFYDLIKPDKFFIIPDNLPPHKISKDLAGSEDRINMCKLSFNKEKFIISDLEIKRKGKSYTIDTLLELKKQFLDSTIYYIMGSDMFVTLTEWKDYKHILKLAVICTAARDFNEEQMIYEFAEKLKLDGAEILAPVFPVNVISSTEIRKMIKQKQDVSRFLSPLVYSYIKEKNLYKSKGFFNGN